MEKRIALVIGLALVFGLALVVSSLWALPRLAGAESLIPNFPGLLASAVLVAFVILTVFPLREMDYIDRFINRVTPLPSEELEEQGG